MNEKDNFETMFGSYMNCAIEKHGHPERDEDEIMEFDKCRLLFLEMERLVPESAAWGEAEWEAAGRVFFSQDDDFCESVEKTVQAVFDAVEKERMEAPRP